DRALKTVRRLHVLVDEDRRRRAGQTTDHAGSQYGGIRRARIREVVHTPCRVLAFLESDEARHAIVNDPESATHESRVLAAWIPRERDTRREVAELILAMNGTEIIRQRRNGLQLGIGR